MRLFGITLNDWLAFGTLIGGFVTLFKKLVIDNLTKSIDGLTFQLEKSEQDRQQLHHDINELDDRLIKQESGLASHIDHYKEHLNYYHHHGGVKDEN